MVLFEIHQRFKGQFLNELHASLNDKALLISKEIKKRKKINTTEKCLIAAEDLLFKGKTYSANFQLTIPEINASKENK